MTAGVISHLKKKGALRLMATVLCAAALILPGEEGGAQCLLGDCLEGSGVILYESGSRYSGEFGGGKRHGTGTFIWLDGKEFTGNFIEGEADGPGRIVLPDGRVKEVVFSKGVLVISRFISFKIFEGDCRFGTIHGRGDYTGWYKGTVKEGYLPHGRGRMVYGNGSIYTGQWEDGKMHGNGTILWDDGSSYVGEWRHGKRRGFGVYRWASGKIYAGQWDENGMSGNGVMSYPDGTVQKGLWKDGGILVEE